MDRDEQQFLEAALIGGRSLANRHNQKVTVVCNGYPTRLQPYFISMTDAKLIRDVSHLSPVLYILPDKCPVVRKARDEQDDKHCAKRRWSTVNR